MTCRTCSHPKLAEIDRAILAGQSNRRIASQCGVSEAAIRRHASHVSATVALAVKAEEGTRADDLLGLLHESVRDARRLRDRAESEGDLRCAVAAVKTLADVVERLASVAEKLANAETKGPRVISLRWLDEPEAEPPPFAPREPSPVRREAAPPEPEPRRIPTERTPPGCYPSPPPQEIPWNVNELPIRRSDGGRSL